MTNKDLIVLLQKDLENERMHCLFYQQAAAIVRGLHREEFRELFLKEAQSELHHVDEFATLIVHLGGIPNTKVADLPDMSVSSPENLCKLAYSIESSVAANYTQRLIETEFSNISDTNTAYFHLFYEDQLTDSQKAAFEFKILCNEQKKSVV